jgi:hypothetical protein
MAAVLKEDRRRVIPAPTTFRSPNGGTRFRVHNGKYTDGIARKICEQIMLKTSLTNITREPNMPSMQTVVRWLADPRLADFREMYYYARRVAAELYVDEIFDIADDGSQDMKERFDKDGVFIEYVTDNEAIQRSRVRIDTRKWYAAKMVPRIYGDKVDVALDATGDLAELLAKASNNDAGLPKPIND